MPRDADIPAAVLGGLKVLQPLNLVFNGSFTVLLRFGISPAKIGSFIGDTGACKKFWTIVGDLSALPFAVFLPEGCKWIAGGAGILIFLTQCRLFYICLFCQGYDAVSKYFFWLCLSGGINHFESVVGIPASGGQVPWFFLAMELYTIFLPSLFGIVTLFGKCFVFDIEFWKLFFQLLSMCLLTLASAILWFTGGADFGKGNYTNETEAITHALSPWALGFIGFGIMFWLFPVVWPFMVCHFSHFRFVMLFAPILGCIATSIPWLFGELNHGKFASKKVESGQTRDHQLDGRLKFHDWADTTYNGWAWNFSWLFVPGSVILFWIIISCVHNPSGYFGRGILHSGWSVLIGSLYFFCSCLAKAFGLNGCAANSIGVVFVERQDDETTPAQWQTAFNSSCFAISLITMTASLFTTQAYSNGYSSFKCALDSGFSWPTQGLGGFRSFCWWWVYGLRYGTKRFFTVSGLKDGFIFIIKGLRRFRSLADVDIISVIS